MLGGLPLRFLLKKISNLEIPKTNFILIYTKKISKMVTKLYTIILKMQQ
jgi:division protein CdvB (Snf7/Vps24/ESCRT-III family)